MIPGRFKVIFNIFRQKPAEELFKIAKEKNIPLIEDASEALFSKFGKNMPKRCLLLKK